MNELNDEMKKMLAKQLPVQATSSQAACPISAPSALCACMTTVR